MAHISQKKLDNKTKGILIKIIEETFSKNSPTQTRKVLSILSSTEKTMIAKRLLIFHLLKKGHTPTEVSEIAKTTLQTVFRYRDKLNLLEAEEKEFLTKRLNAITTRLGFKEVVKSILDTRLPAKQIHRYKT